MQTITFSYNIDADEPTMDAIPLASFEEKMLNNRDQLVISENKMKVLFSYPLDQPIICTFHSKNRFTLLKIVKMIIKKYKKIYKEEEETASIKTIPENLRGKLLNRNRTNGKYQIYAHDLEDLLLTGMTFDKKKNFWRMSIDS